jgi:phosphate transport system substrate-binding protein
MPIQGISATLDFRWKHRVHSPRITKVTVGTSGFYLPTTSLPDNAPCMSSGRIKRISTLVLIPLLLITTTVAAQEKIRVGGEQTLIYMAQRLTKTYQLDQPQGPVFEITGRGRGSAAGLGAQMDIAQVKLPLSQAESRGRRFLRLPVGIEYAVVYVHPTNSVKTLSMGELRAIFNGTIINWKQLGGRDAPIHLCAGESTSGVEDFFRETVLQGNEPAPYYGRSTAKELVATVAGDPNAIGYASLFSAEGARLVPIRRSSGGTAIEPTPENLRSLRYPVAHFIYWYLAGRPRPPVRSFAEWVFSNRGQLVVESVGFMPLLPEQRSKALGTIPMK